MNFLTTLFSFLTWRHLTRRPPHVPYNPPLDCGPEEYISCAPKGPPPEQEENPCSNFVTPELYEQIVAERAIAKFEKQYNS